MATIRAGARIHVGFQNLSLAHPRLYGGIGVALDAPGVTVQATPADTLECDHELGIEYARQTLADLSVPGVSLRIDSQLPRHVGLGSGTQLALAVYTAIARAYDRTADVRSVAPTLGRGGRSGVGVAGFEQGGFIVDGGHPTTPFTTDPPTPGTWDVPPVIARHRVPESWRFVLIVPDAPRGRNGTREEQSIRATVENATPEIADQISTILTRRLLPAIATGDLQSTGDALTDIDRLNGAWYADEQGGVYRPPVGTLIEQLLESPAIAGAGQSSWGPTTYGLTTVDRLDAATTVAREALQFAGIEGTIRVASATNRGATVSSGE